jgi:hypothetical protein
MKDEVPVHAKKVYRESMAVHIGKYAVFVTVILL